MPAVPASLGCHARRRRGMLGLKHSISPRVSKKFQGIAVGWKPEGLRPGEAGRQPSQPRQRQPGCLQDASLAVSEGVPVLGDAGAHPRPPCLRPSAQQQPLWLLGQSPCGSQVPLQCSACLFLLLLYFFNRNINPMCL